MSRVLVRLPSLDPIWTQHCVSLDRPATFSLGSGPYEVTVSPSGASPSRCTCPGFAFRKRCKHVDEAMSLVCGWDSRYNEEEQDLQGMNDMRCPKCGGETALTEA